MPALYQTKAIATGGRDGAAHTEDLKLKVKLVKPKEMGGTGEDDGTNPEQLFAVGYSGCFLGALKFIASKEGIEVSEDSTVSATVGIAQRADGKGYGITAALTVKLPGLERAVAEDLAAKAHIFCPYSHALRASTEVPITIIS